MNAPRTGTAAPSINFYFDTEQMCCYNAFKRHLYAYALKNNLAFPQKNKIIDFVISHVNPDALICKQLYQYSHAKTGYSPHVLSCSITEENSRKLAKLYNSSICFAGRNRTPGTSTSHIIGYILSHLNEDHASLYYTM